ncbi:Helicase protein [Aphelenchoides besseyi]|nr:Helicase protein [Aphelenchoides besseyi]
MAQQHRDCVLHGLHQENCRYLVCSDLLSRGIDIQNVNVVIRFEFPRNSETYLHRVGQCFERSGIAINFINYEDHQNLRRMEHEIQTFIDPLPKEVDPKLYVVECQLVRAVV